MDLPPSRASLPEITMAEDGPTDGRSEADSFQPFQPDLFPPPRGHADALAKLSGILANAGKRVRSGAVRSTASLGDMSAELSAFDFSNPRPLDDVTDWVVERLTDGIVHTAHPRYFGLFNPSPSFPAICAEHIVAAFNPQLATATTSPFPVLLEVHVIDAVARRLGVSGPSGGHFTSGGSEANATALVCALTQQDPTFGRGGARVFRGPPRLYVSRDAHLAWVKISHQTGIGREAVRLVPTDGAGRMDPGALAGMVAEDVWQGDAPIMIASTAGTTNAGMIDPLLACADIARRYGIWHHVDAAWGGAAIASSRIRHVLNGIEVADSVTIDAHKWFATTMGCGMFLTTRPQTLSDAFGVVMDCMPSHEVGLDPYITTMQWSRRFLGLRLFLALATAGWNGFAYHVERAIWMAAELERKLKAGGWKTRNASALAVLCMQPPTGSVDSRTIASRIVRDGAAWVSPVEFEGETLIRACITSGETTIGDISLLCEKLNAYAAP